VIKWNNLPMPVFLKKTGALLLALVVSFSVGEIFHFQGKGRVAAIIVLSAVFGLYFVFERVISSLCGRSGEHSDAP
jgi:hypothetical protein